MAELQKTNSENRLAGFKVIGVMVALMWGLEVIDAIAGGSLDEYGIEPRDDGGLVGVVAAPFLHAGFGHLIANTVPFVVMGLVIALKGAVRVLAVTAIVGLISGLGTWLVAPEFTLHIGASGVVFGYATYLVSRGAFNRDALELAVGLIVVLVWARRCSGGCVPRTASPGRGICSAPSAASWPRACCGASAPLCRPDRDGSVRRGLLDELVAHLLPQLREPDRLVGDQGHQHGK